MPLDFSTFLNLNFLQVYLKGMKWKYNKATSKYKMKKYNIYEKAVSVNYDNTQKHAMEIVFFSLSISSMKCQHYEEVQLLQVFIACWQPRWFLVWKSSKLIFLDRGKMCPLLMRSSFGVNSVLTIRANWLHCNKSQALEKWHFSWT